MTQVEAAVTAAEVTFRDSVFDLHRGGKVRIEPTVSLDDRSALSMAYTPGVAEVSLALAEDPGLAYDFTWKSSSVAVVTDGTAVLGLGDIGPVAALPVMEGKSALFARFAGINAVPICLDTRDVDELVDTVVRLAPGFGGINLEDISAPRCFEVERRLQALLDIPVFHDDQHGTAIVVLAGLINAARVVAKPMEELRVVISGAGAAGVAVARILIDSGVADVTVGDRTGVIHQGRPDLTEEKLRLAAISNPRRLEGDLGSALVGADVFVGVSGGVVPEAWIAGMGERSIVFSLANPTPEVDPVMAARYAAVVATGRSDLPNQINNVLAFPGVFAGALEARATSITPGMKLAAAHALAELIRAEASPDLVVPAVFDPRVVPAVAAAVSEQARAEGVVRRPSTFPAPALSPEAPWNAG